MCQVMLSYLKAVAEDTLQDYYYYYYYYYR